MSYLCTDCIIAHMEAAGPQTQHSLRWECKTQATDYTPANFDLAISVLCAKGKIVGDVMDEDSNPVAYFDFPDSYYLPA